MRGNALTRPGDGPIRVLRVLVVCLVVSGCRLEGPTLPAPDDTPTTYSGRATVVKATVNGQTSTLIEAGPLPSEGGTSEASLLTVNLADLLAAEIAHAATIAGNDTVHSEASLADIQLDVGGHQISADFLIARAFAQCEQGAPAVRGDFDVANLMIDGKPIVVNADPNQQTTLFDLAGAQVGRVTINQQLRSLQENFAEITVNGIRLEIFGAADVVLFQAHADITCGVTAPSAGDFITGGGRIGGTPSGGLATFGVAAGALFDGFWGHLNYVDKAADMHVRSTALTGYTLVNAATRRVEGLAEINGQAGFTYAVELADNGEPGTADVFSIQLSNGYSAGGNLVGGNIQLHAAVNP